MTMLILLYALAALCVGLLFYIAVHEDYGYGDEDWGLFDGDWKAAILAGVLWPITGFTLTGCLILDVVETVKPTAIRAWDSTTGSIRRAWNAGIDGIRKAWNWATAWI